MQGLNFKVGMGLVLVAGGFLAVSAFVLAGAFASSEAATGDAARNSVVGGTRKTPVKNADDPAAKDVPEAEYRERLARIRQLSDEGNFQELVKEGDAIRDIWGSIGGERFARLTLEVTGGLGRTDVLRVNPDARNLREKYAIAALGRSDSYGIESEMHLLFTLRYSGTATSYNDVEALKVRDSSKLWLHLLARLESEKDPSVNLDPYQSLPMHLTTPVELRMVEIEDPLAAARLRAAEAEHHEKLRKVSYQGQLRNLSDIAEKVGTRFLANVYSRPPFSREELSTLLSEHSIAESLRRSILKARDDLMPSG